MGSGINELKRLLYTLPRYECGRCKRASVVPVIICAACNDYAFANYIAPVIQRMAGAGTDVMRHIMAVQPLNEPDPRVFYMDFIRP